MLKLSFELDSGCEYNTKNGTKESFSPKKINEILCRLTQKDFADYLKKTKLKDCLMSLLAKLMVKKAAKFFVAHQTQFLLMKRENGKPFVCVCYLVLYIIYHGYGMSLYII